MPIIAGIGLVALVVWGAADLVDEIEELGRAPMKAGLPLWQIVVVGGVAYVVYHQTKK